MKDLKHIREDFPQYKNAGAFHYMDAAATSLTPSVVLDAVNAYYETARANVHRGIFTEAVRATELYEGARSKVAALIGATTPHEVLFTSGATDSSNMLVRMLEESSKLKGKKNIVTTEMEHHGSLIPLQQLAKRASLQLHTIPMTGLELDYAQADTLITDETAVVAIILASNVTGTINDVRRIADIAHKHGAVVVVDATAAMGHISVDVHAVGADALYFSGHKMFAPTGIGILWVSLPLLETLEPAAFGGHMISRVEKDESTWAPIPERFEAGTKDIGGAIGLGAAVDYINAIGLPAIHKHNATLAFYAIHKLEQIAGVKVYSPCDPEKNVGIVSFTCDFAHPHDIAEILARDNVAVRPGHHCAIPLHAALGIVATTRASFHVYNTREDVDALVESINKARAIFT